MLVEGIITPIIKQYVKNNKNVVSPTEAAKALKKTLNKAVNKGTKGVYPDWSSTRPLTQASGNVTEAPNTLFTKIFNQLQPKSVADPRASIKKLLREFKEKNPGYDFAGKEGAIAGIINKQHLRAHPKHAPLIQEQHGGRSSGLFREVWDELELPKLTSSERAYKMGIKQAPKITGIGSRTLLPNLDAYTKTFLKKHTNLDEASSEFRGITEMMEQAIRRDKAKDWLGIRLGDYSKSQIRKLSDKHKSQFKKNIQDKNFMEKYYDEVSSYRGKGAAYIDEADAAFAEDLYRYRDEVYNYMKARGMTEESIKKMFAPYFKTVGHKGPIGASYEDFLKTGNLASLETWKAGAKPRMWEPELGAINKAKDITDRLIFNALRKEDLQYPSQLKGIDEMRRLYGDVGLTSIIRGKPIGEGYDLTKQADFLAKQTGRGMNPFTGPFGHSGANWEKLKRQWMNMLIRGDRGYKDVLGFAAGGIANIGAKILPKLAKKLSKKELKLIMDTLFKGTRPLMGPKYKRQMKLARYLDEKYGKKTTWPFVRSEIPGPVSSLRRMQDEEFFKHTEFWPTDDMIQASREAGKIVKFPSAGGIEDVFRSGRLADRKWEQEMLKRRIIAGLQKEGPLKYPFLDPANTAKIVTGPREGLMRYQLQTMINPDKMSLGKYSVYDWWDDVLQQMRKKPKFKYVKDDKGNVIMKKVK